MFLKFVDFFKTTFYNHKYGILIFQLLYAHKIIILVNLIIIIIILW